LSRKRWDDAADEFFGAWACAKIYIFFSVPKMDHVVLRQQPFSSSAILGDYVVLALSVAGA
jgi:hypothetical protein